MLKIDVKKDFKNFNLNVNMDVKNGEFVSIYGNSGSGKTTLLNLIAGLAKPDSGDINMGRATWFSKDARINLKPQKREVGYLFQEHRIFPNMTVRQNIEFAAGKESMDKDEIEELLKLTELKKYENLNSKQLSGGQKQRLALARAIVRKPQLFLLDEPMSSLDFEIKLMMNEKIREIHKRYKPTIIMISHSIKEIVNVSDRIFFMEKGRIIRSKKVKEMNLDSHIGLSNCAIRDIVLNNF